MTILKGKRWRTLRIAAIVLFSFFILIAAAYVILIANRKNILAAVTSSINHRIKGKIEIGDIHFTLFEEFPSVTIRLQHILITDSLMGIKSDTILTARQFLIAVPLWNLLNKKVSVRSLSLENASISLLKNAAGVTNLRIFQPSANNQKSEEGGGIQPDKIKLRDVSFSYSDSSKLKSFSFRFKKGEIKLTYPDSSVSFQLKSTMHVDHLVFNSVKGGYLTQKEIDLDVSGSVLPDSRLLKIPGGRVKVEDQVVGFNGIFQFGTPSSLQLNFISRSIKSDIAFSLFPQAIAKKLVPYRFYKPLHVVAKISGSLAPGDKPSIDVYFKTSQNRLSYAAASFEDLTLLGWFTNHIDSTQINDDHNSRMIIPVFKGTIFTVPLKAQLTITDLISPVLLMRASSFLDKKTEEKIVDSTRLKIISGDAQFLFSYYGPLVHYIDTVNNKITATVNGSLILNNISLDYLPKGFQFRNISGSMVFDQNDLHVNTVSFELNDNSAYLTGSFIQFIPRLFYSQAVAHGDLSLTAGTIDINKFNFEKDTASVSPKTEKEKEVASNHIATVINQLMDRFEFNFKLHADSVKYKHFVATGVQSELVYANDYVHFKNTEMKAAGGNFSFTGDLTKLGQPKHEVNLHATINNADISSLMVGFENFGQTTVTDKDVDGKLKADISFQTQLNKSFNVIPSTMMGRMKVSIKNGELKNFESIEQISKYIFKNRDFSNVKFSGVENEYELKGSQINFTHLDVYSSVLTFFVEGKYDFKKSNTMLLIHVPLSNLKRMRTEELAEHPDSTRKAGVGPTFKATYGEDDKIRITPVLFGKKKIREEISSKEIKKPNEVTDTLKKN